MEFLNGYFVAVVFGVCLCAGYIIKHYIPTSKVNKFIPLIVAVLGVFVNVWLNGWGITPSVLLGGLFSGLASTGAHQALKQFINGRDKNGNNA